MPTSSFIQVRAGSLSHPMVDFKSFHTLMQNMIINDCGEGGRVKKKCSMSWGICREYLQPSYFHRDRELFAATWTAVESKMSCLEKTALACGVLWRDRMQSNPSPFVVTLAHVLCSVAHQNVQCWMFLLQVG